MAVRDSTTNKATSAARSVAVPTGVAINDIVLLFATCDGAANTNGTIPANFTAFFTDSAVTADGQVITAAWKRLTAADSGSYTFGGTPSNADWVCQAMALSGRHTTNPPVAGTVAVQNTGQPSPVNVNATGVTAVDGDDLVWLSAPDSTVGGAVTGHTPPAGYVEWEDDGAAFAAMSLAAKENVSAGATGTVTGSFTLSGGLGGWLADLIRVPTAPGGAPASHNLAALGVGT